ncbi:hepatitis A virus cellular receptor 1 [Hyalella azteca]|uniref:Hepatitis A virus cellular receptor 1 n=1 Tax=Hyalella azteca TaxID=294128 RepID=A0A8B7PNU2_HYAAZ|nr:hepatitis A virus cellular receptor 1 [Hyalella azteca]
MILGASSFILIISMATMIEARVPTTVTIRDVDTTTDASATTVPTTVTIRDVDTTTDASATTLTRTEAATALLPAATTTEAATMLDESAQNEARLFGLVARTTTVLTAVSSTTSTKTCIVLRTPALCRKRRYLEVQPTLSTEENLTGDVELSGSMLDSSRPDEEIADKSPRGFLTFWRATTSTVVLTSNITSFHAPNNFEGLLRNLMCTATLCVNN